MSFVGIHNFNKYWFTFGIVNSNANCVITILHFYFQHVYCLSSNKRLCKNLQIHLYCLCLVYFLQSSIARIDFKVLLRLLSVDLRTENHNLETLSIQTSINRVWPEKVHSTFIFSRISSRSSSFVNRKCFRAI